MQSHNNSANLPAKNVGVLAPSTRQLFPSVKMIKKTRRITFEKDVEKICRKQTAKSSHTSRDSQFASCDLNLWSNIDH